MKRYFYTILFFCGVLFFSDADDFTGDTANNNGKADMSYAFGMIIAADLAETGLEFNYDEFISGFRGVMENEKTRYTMDEAMEKIDAAFEAARAELAEQNRTLGTAFLTENGNRPEVTVTPSGLQYELISEGSGDKPGPADLVRVHYHGTLIDGTMFDTTYERGMPAEIPLDRVIPGWSEGLRMMKEGGKAKLYIPPDLAYGESGAGGVIGPGSVIVFDIELLEIIRPDEEE